MAVFLKKDKLKLPPEMKYIGNAESHWCCFQQKFPLYLRENGCHKEKDKQRRVLKCEAPMSFFVLQDKTEGNVLLRTVQGRLYKGSVTEKGWF